MLPYKFTAKELDEETGLYYYGARYLNPRTSKWISADPAGFELINPNRDGFNFIESQNWYSYVGNSPIKYRDPTGLKSADAAYSRQEVMNDTYSPNYSDKAQEAKDTVAPLLESADIQPGYTSWNGYTNEGLSKEAGAEEGVTWCNRFLYRAFTDLGGDSESNTEEKEIGYTSANMMIDLLDQGLDAGFVFSATPRAAQFFANQGAIVIAGMSSRRGSGHVGLVVGDQFRFDSTKGPLTMQAGASVGKMYASEGFESGNLENINYYVFSPGMLK